MATRKWRIVVFGLAASLLALILAMSLGGLRQTSAGAAMAEPPMPSQTDTAAQATPEPTATPERPTSTRQPPCFTGVTTYQDPLDRFWVRYPSDWTVLVSEASAHDGVSFQPNPEDSRTLFSLSVKSLERRIVAEDLAALRASAREELDRLPAIEVETFSETVLDDVIRLELVYSFREDEATLKRKTWLVYGSRTQYVVTWQGSSPAEYEYWLAMANYSFATLQLPPSLWFDPDSDFVTAAA